MVSWVLTDRAFYCPDRPLMCPLFGLSIPVSIYTDGKEIRPDQLDTLSRFLDIPLDRRARLIDPLFADYRSVVEATGEGPVIHRTDEVWQNVRWTNVIVPLQGPTGSRFVFVQGDPTWEEEHGVELLFRDEELIRLDRASGAFLSNCFWEWS